MEALIAQIQRVWPNANWSVARREGRFIGYVSNGEIVGTKRFASGWVETRDAASALNKAFIAALDQASSKETK